jgi:hypothetical protein
VIAAPDIQGVSYTGADRLPSPPVVWAVLIGAAIVIFLITRWQRGRAR